MSKLYALCLFFIQFLSFSLDAKTNAEVYNYICYVYKDPLVITTISGSFKKIKNLPLRSPASRMPNDDFDIVPPSSEIWLNSVFVEDNAGVMNEIKDQLREWERMEMYRHNWDIESTGLYDTPDDSRKKAWFNRMLLRYADRRFNSELKNAEPNSGLKRVSNVKQALRPSSEASFSKNLKLKFKARILRLEGRVRVINPWVDLETTMNARGEIRSRLSKNIESIGVRAELNYLVHENRYQAIFSRSLSENVAAILSSNQSDKDMAFSNTGDNTLRLVYSTPF